jgi:hypothetical protein
VNATKAVLARFHPGERQYKAHQGVIEKFIGDGAMIVFGVPTPQPDDARRAIACGLDPIAAVEEWNAHRDIDSCLAIVAGIRESMPDPAFAESSGSKRVVRGCWLWRRLRAFGASTSARSGKPS